MSSQTFSGFNELLVREADNSIYISQVFLGNLITYWNKNHIDKTKISLKHTEDVLEILIPACKFHCYTETKLVSLDKKLITEISFYTLEDSKRKKFHQIYIDRDKQLTAKTPDNEPSIDIEYARHAEEYVFNTILEAAVTAKLL